MSLSAKSIKSIFCTFFFFCLFQLCPEASAQYCIEKKIDSGEDFSKFVWVMLSEGYTELEFEKFQHDSFHLIDAFLSTSPWKEYKSAINIYTVFTPSDESGADHPTDGIYVDTAFDATFDTYGISRLLTVNEAKAFNAASQIPYFDAVFVLVNDDQYGGSGGSVIAVSTHEASKDIAMHEAGHVIGKLADEYENPYPGYPEGDWEPNVTFHIQKDKIPWKNWIDVDTPLPTPNCSPDSIGAFEGARYRSDGIYRPKHICKMRTLNQPFCEICKEALVLNIYNIVDPIEKFGPLETDIFLTPGSAITLWVEPLKLEGSTYDLLWEIDSEILKNESQTALSLSPSWFKQGKHTVSIWISDITEMVKADPQCLLTSKQTWNILKNFCSGKFSGSILDEKTGQNVSDATISISNTNKILYSNKDGEYALSDITCGEYSIIVEAPGFRTFQKKISILDGEETAVDVLLEPMEGSYYIAGNITGDIDEEVTVTLSGDASSSTKTNMAKGFFLGPAKPGEYSIKPSAPGYRFSPSSRSLTIKNRNISGINFNARKTGFLFLISGRVQGDIKESILVTASGKSGATTFTDAQGNFKFDNLRPGQYVLKPDYLGVTFEPHQLKVDLLEEDMKGINFMSQESSCPASQILSQRSSYIKYLRKFRDNVLRKNEKGRSYIQLYYLVSPEVSKLLQKSKPLRREALQTLNTCMPLIKNLVEGKDVVIPDETQVKIKIFAQHVSLHGSPILQKVIGHFLQDLEQEFFVQTLSPNQ